MKILKLLNKKYLSIILSFFFFLNSNLYSTEPVDIWSLNKEESNTESINDEKIPNNTSTTNSIYEMQTEKKNEFEVEQDETLYSSNIKVSGLYDPSENGLKIDMWTNSDGKEIIDIFNRIQKIELSSDANEILNLALLTNSYFPEINISNKKFLELKSEWLIKNNNLELAESYLIKNQNVSENSKIIKFLVEEYLSRSELQKSCDIFSKINESIDDDYLSIFNIYCLINSNKRDEAQLQLDLKKEMGFKNDFFEKKFNYLMGYNTTVDQIISTENILNFHLSHRTNPDFTFEPDGTTPKNIWRYLSNSNLLVNTEDINLDDLNKISIIEKATHEGNYKEKKLYDLYKRFQFNINQLLTVKQSYKLLSDLEGRALIYQGILITSDIESKLNLMKILKESFIKEKIENAFNDELVNFLKEINSEDIPSNYTNFYNKYLQSQKTSLTKIKINNKIIHQSKLLNYFRKSMTKKNIEKDLNDLLKKIKKDKSYFISTKDIILVESLRSDGINVLKKYKNLYELDDSNMPSDIQEFIDKDEIGMVLLRIVEVIGQDQLKDIGPETLYFIINTLNQLDIDPIRNRILLKVLPLKV
jgi:hypothetical protein